MTHSEVIKLVKKHLKKNNLTEAKNLLEIVLNQFPNDKFAKKELKKISNFQANKAALISETQKNDLIKLFHTHKEQALQSALSLQKDYPKDFFLLNFIGVLFENFKNYQQALTYYKLAIKENDKFADAHFNLGNIYSSLDEYENTITQYKETLKINPNYIQAYNNLGLEYFKALNLSHCIDAYQKAININPDYQDAISNIIPLYIQTNNLNEIKELNLVSNNLLEKINLAIFFFLIKSFQNTSNMLVNVQHQIQELSNYSENKKKFIFGYFSFLQKLNPYMIENNKVTNSQNYPIIYHVGESHSLSFAHCQTSIENQTHTIKPCLIYGAKAWHLQKKANNIQKRMFENHINTLEKYAKVLLSFGEIDCRKDEGIIKYYLQSSLELEEVVKNTVTQYIDYTQSVLKNKDLNVIYMGIPAPTIKALEESDEISLLQIQTVKLFNDNLLDIAKQKNLKIIDIYELTKKENGMSNLKYMCDEVHLHPDTLKYLELEF